MTKWEERFIKKVKEVIKHGWGRAEIIISSNGKRKTISQTFTDVIEEEKKELKTSK